MTPGCRCRVARRVPNCGAEPRRAGARSCVRKAAVLNADLQRLVAWQFFWVDGRLTASPAKAELWGAWQKLKGQGDDGAIVVL